MSLTGRAKKRLQSLSRRTCKHCVAGFCVTTAGKIQDTSSQRPTKAKSWVQSKKWIQSLSHYCSKRCVTGFRFPTARKIQDTSSQQPTDAGTGTCGTGIGTGNVGVAGEIQNTST